MIMKYTYNILAYLLLFFLASCSDEELVNSSRPKDGELTEMTFTLCIPQEERVTTRAAATESDVKELYVLVFTTEADDGTLVEQHPFTETELEPADVTAGTEKVVRRKFTVKLEASSTPRAIYVVANANEALRTMGLTEGTTTVKEVKNLTTALTATDLADGTPFVMSGVKTSPIPGVSLLDTDFPLIRSVAKVTVDNQADEFTYQSFQLWNGNTEGSILAGCTPNDALTRVAENGSIGTAQTGEELYTYPCKNEDNKTFLIVYGQYKGTGYYWRIDLKDDDGNLLDILPNHHYEVCIERINAIGYTSADEAAKHPSDGRAEAVIYDHEPEIHNMITDGSFELGVTDTIKIASSYAQEGEFYVKIQGNDITNLSTVDINIEIPDPQKDYWITIVTDENNNTTPKLLETTPLSGNDEETKTPQTGIQYKYSITVKENLSGGVRYGTVRVTANGLSRDIIVEQKTEFLGWHFPVSLTMNAGLDTEGEQITINEYWKFLFGDEVQIQGAQSDASYIRLLGMEHNEKSINNDDKRMGGKTRTRGFHFSVNDGQTFKYTFQLTNNGANNAGVDWYVRVNEPYKSRLKFEIPEGNSNVIWIGEDNLPHGKGVIGQSFTFTDDPNGTSTTSTGTTGPSGDDAYRYGSGAFVLVLTTPATEATQATTTEISYDLYHTGIFAEGSAQQYNVRNNLDDTFSSTLATGQSGTYWYYYEVIKMGTYYWLDRNLGATSSGNYIQEDNGNSLFTTDSWPFYQESAGELYSIVDGKLDNSESKNFANVCPPGYRVPTASEFNDLVRNGDFHIESSSYNNVSYWDTYYESSAFGRFYFPKNRMTYGNSSSGDGKAGYYWTRTEALGTSGDEQGHWLQFMKFMGSNGSLGRARTTQSGATAGTFNSNAKTGMSVRCVSANSSYDEKIYTWEIYFTGYTHVFLYNKNEDGTIEYLNTWPGEMVCYYNGEKKDDGTLTDSDKAALAKSNIFTFTSTTKYTGLHVIFNRVKADGEVEDKLYQSGTDEKPIGFPVPAMPDGSTNVRSTFDTTNRTWSTY